MSIEANIKTAEEHLEAEANRELDRLLATLAEDSIYEESLLEKPVQGKAAIAEYYQELWKAFPDFTYVVTNRVADESSVIYEMTFRGTHTGPFRGIPPTRRSGEIKGVIVFPMRNGKASPSPLCSAEDQRKKNEKNVMAATAEPGVPIQQRVSNTGEGWCRRSRSRGPRSCDGCRRRPGRAW